MEYATLVAVYERLAGTQSTNEKTAIVADHLAAIPDADLPMHVQLLRSAVFADWRPDDLGVSSSLASRAIATASGHSADDIEARWRETGDLGDAAADAIDEQVQQTLVSNPLSVERVYETLRSLAAVEGTGSEQRRVGEIAGLLSDADPLEAKYVVRTAVGTLRLGIGEGTIRDAIATAFLASADSEAVERALQVTNDAGLVARTAATEGQDGLDDLELAVHRPVKVMLAEKTDSIDQALADAGASDGDEQTATDDGTVSLSRFLDTPEDASQSGVDPLVEYKVDGFRAQVHATPDETRIFTRRLADVTQQFPDVVEAVEAGFDADSFVLEGEILGYDPETGVPVPFQQLSRRIKRKYDVEKLVDDVPVVLYAFDLLAVDGETLLEETLSERVERLERHIDGEPMAFERIPNITTSDRDTAQSFYDDALAAGHEGVMVKDPTATYQPGTRVGNMLKVKPTMEPLDLTVLRAEWSEGRRSNNLGKLVLGCRDPDGGFREVGRLSTGFTDEQLAELTDRLEANIVGEDGREVDLEPTEVLEVAYEEIQESPAYDSGYALRFPRFERFRDDLAVEEVDTIDRVASLFDAQ